MFAPGRIRASTLACEGLLRTRGGAWRATQPRAPLRRAEKGAGRQLALTPHGAQAPSPKAMSKLALGLPVDCAVRVSDGSLVAGCSALTGDVWDGQLVLASLPSLGHSAKRRIRCGVTSLAVLDGSDGARLGVGRDDGQVAVRPRSLPTPPAAAFHVTRARSGTRLSSRSTASAAVPATRPRAGKGCARWTRSGCCAATGPRSQPWPPALVKHLFPPRGMAR